MAAIETSRGKVGVVEHGSGVRTPIIFLHGVGSDKSVWRPQLEHFARTRRALAFDYPGYGESAFVEGATREDFAASILAAMDALEIEKAHVSQADGAALEATFTGTRLVWYGLENADLGTADVFIDGVLVGEGIDCYSPVRRPAELFAISELENSFHTVRIVATGEQNPSSTGSAIVHDYFVASVALE